MNILKSFRNFLKLLWFDNIFIGIIRKYPLLLSEVDLRTIFLVKLQSDAALDSDFKNYSVFLPIFIAQAYCNFTIFSK